MSDTRNHTTRDQLAKVVADAICGRGDRPSYSPDQPCRAHLMQAEYAADALLASDAIAAVRAAAVAETTATIEALATYWESENAWGIGEQLSSALRAALSGGRTALDTTLAQAWDQGYETGYDDCIFDERGLSTHPDAHEYPHTNPYRTGADQ